MGWRNVTCRLGIFIQYSCVFGMSRSRRVELAEDACMFERILAALDTSEIAAEVADKSIALAKSTRSSLTFVRVLASEDMETLKLLPEAVSAPLFWEDWQAYQTYCQTWETYVEESAAELRARVEQARAAGIEANFEHLSGNPGREICKFAERWQADTIVMGRRGHRELQALLMGSVSNYVVHYAPCSVMIVRDPEGDVASEVRTIPSSTVNGSSHAKLPSLAR